MDVWQAREENGFGAIRLLCPREHINSMRWLAQFTRKVLQLAGSGHKQGVSQHFQAKYSRALGPVIKMNLRSALQSISARGSAGHLQIEASPDGP